MGALSGGKKGGYEAFQHSSHHVGHDAGCGGWGEITFALTVIRMRRREK